MAESVKIAQCGANGNLELDPEVYCDLDEQTAQSVMATREGEIAALASKLDVADSEADYGAYAEAINTYISVLHSCVKGQSVRRGYESLARRAYGGLVKAGECGGDYGWETTRDVIDFYGKIL